MTNSIFVFWKKNFNLNIISKAPILKANSTNCLIPRLVRFASLGDPSTQNSFRPPRPQRWPGFAPGRLVFLKICCVLGFDCPGLFCPSFVCFALELFCN